MTDQNTKKVDLQEFSEWCVASDVVINSRDIAIGDIVSLYKKGEDDISIETKVIEDLGENNFMGIVMGFGYAIKDIAKVVAPGEYHEFLFQDIKLGHLIPFKRINVKGFAHWSRPRSVQ